MHSQQQFCNSLFRATAGTAALATALALAAVPALAQNAVPPTARQAASSPAFASRLAHPATAQKAGKAKAGAPARRALPQSGQYDNGPINGTTDAWTLNFGFTTSNSYTGVGGAGNTLNIGVWLFPGDNLGSVDIDFGSTSFASDYGHVSGAAATLVSDLGINQYGYDIREYSLNLGGVGTGRSGYVTLGNAVETVFGDPIYWDENSGIGCTSQGCPSTAYENTLGSIPSEAFSLDGGYVPECVHDVPQDGFKIIHSFTNQEQSPNGVAPDRAGNLYGTTASGGDWASGLVYELSLKGQDWMFAARYSFTGGNDGIGPLPVIVGPEGALYGTAGGGIENCGGQKCGLVFRVRPGPTACRTALCSWTEDVLYRFNGGNDAWGPGDHLVFDQAGHLYGTTPTGGAYGHGTVFELTRSSGSWTEMVIYSFTGGSDGDQPNKLLVGHDGNLYGLAEAGGAYGFGLVFQLVPSGDGWTENVLLNFSDDYHGLPPSSLVQDNFGNLYGISNYYRCLDDQGYYYCDNLSRIFTGSASSDGWQFTVIDDTAYHYPVYDWGYSIYRDLAIDAQGTLYATEGWAQFGWPYCEGYCYWGSVFSSAHWQDLIDFSGDNFSNLTLDAQGNIYGTTSGCGQYNKGTVWQLTPQQ